MLHDEDNQRILRDVVQSIPDLPESTICVQSSPVFCMKNKTLLSREIRDKEIEGIAQHYIVIHFRYLSEKFVDSLCESVF